MTKTICDICGRDAKNKCIIPIFNEYQIEDLGYIVKEDQGLSIKNIDICEVCMKKISYEILNIIIDEKRRKGNVNY